MSNRFVYVLATVIIAVWLVAFIETLVRPNYRIPESVAWTMSIVTGAAFGAVTARGAGIGGNGNDESRKR